MPPSLQEEIQLSPPQGAVVVRAFCRAEEIRRYDFDRQFGTHAQYKSLYTRRESLEDNAEQQGANVTLALHDTTIIGFGVLGHPEPGERWAALGPGIVMEVKAIEVGRNWRSGKVAAGILEMLLTHPKVEEMIVYMVGYSWTWDLDGTRMTAQAYRNMLIHLFEPFGFQELQTNEANICLKPENLFMGRIGEQVPEETRQTFKWLRFGVTPQG